eukprot:4906458-Amphidinium_carterae.1
MQQGLNCELLMFAQFSHNACFHPLPSLSPRHKGKHSTPHSRSGLQMYQTITNLAWSQLVLKSDSSFGVLQDQDLGDPRRLLTFLKFRFQC